MGPDFRVLVTRARKSAQAYWKLHGEYPPTKILTQEIATIMQQATHSGYVRCITLCIVWFSYVCLCVQRCSSIRRVIARCRLGHHTGADFVSGRSFRLLLGVESKCHREKYG